MSFAGLLAAVMIVCFLAFMGFKAYFKPTRSQDNAQVKEVAAEQGIDTSDYSSMLKDIRSQINASSQKEIDRLDEMEQLR
ncbi:MAG: hypothetical protein V1863_03075 [Candidatus Omnitrophota bacterium]